MGIRLEDVNAVITEHGYRPLGQQQFDDLLAVLGPDFLGWVLECARHGREASAWDGLRDALYGASLHCEQALKRMGAVVKRPQMILKMREHGKDLRVVIARAAKEVEEGRAPAPADVEYLERALGVRLQRAPAERSAPRSSDGGRKPDPAALHHVYGRAFAFTFECTNDIRGRFALQVEAAARSQRGQGFDWTDKIALQLTDHEVVELLAVVRGVKSEATFEHHGQHRDKSMTIREQRGEQPSIYFNVRRGAVSRTVPVPVFNAFRIEALATRVLLANEPGLSAADVAQRIDRLASRFNQAA
jgi:hypothetical protein